MQFLRMLFTWWHSQTLGTALTTWRHGELVGMDVQGNRYYRDKKIKSITNESHVYPEIAALFSSATDIFIENKRIDEEISPFSILFGRSFIKKSTALKQKS